MQITLQQAGRRFNRDWIFRKMDAAFAEGGKYAITGANGSGKSTLLQVLAGSMTLSEGQCHWQHNNQPLQQDAVFVHMGMAAPYLDIIEEMTATEFLHFHHAFKPLLPGLTIPAILQRIGLEKASNKQIRYYSSGMRQRIKLAQAIFTSAPLLLLDEPCTNLDAAGIQLYHSLINEYCSNKLVIVSSNDEQEYAFCTEILHITNWKPA
jgi:ABC-type multidrug transport system ATPase subunit